MIQFYQTLQQSDLSVVLALRQTQTWLREATVQDLLDWIDSCAVISPERREEMKEIIDSYPIDYQPFESPYYWAPFCAIGHYHLQEDDTQGDSHPLWSNCDRLLSHLTDTRLTPHLHHGENRILLSPNQKQISFTPYELPDIPKMEGFIQPVQIPEDSYGVFFNIGYDDSNPANLVEISTLQSFNPQQILPLTPSRYFLGQTLLLTLNLTPDTQNLTKAELTELANQCYHALFSKDNSPSRLGELFGSPIFEYGNPRQPDKSPHILIWLFRDKIADRNLSKSFQPTFDLFFYRHKITKAFQDSREIYQQIKQYYLSLDPTLDEIQAQIDAAKPDPQDAAYLQILKTQLKQLAADSLIYDRLLRKLKDFLNTITINLNNYNDRIEQICAILGTDKEELSFWRHFGEQTAPQFQRQIEADLSYFEQGTGLISQAVASIRAIVEIDQAQCDRIWQQEEKERDKRHEKDNQDLQDQIQAVGVGIAAGAIVASVAALAFQEPMTFPWQEQRGEKLHPFTIAFLLSFAFAGLAWWGAKWLIGWGRKRRSV